MEARFAGSQRLDERRRRRLVSEADEPSSGGQSESEAAPVADGQPGNIRFHDSPEVDAEGPNLELAIPNIFPRALWQHLLIGGAWGVLGGLILWAGHVWRDVAATHVELKRLMLPERGALFSWAGGMILLWTAQMAWLTRCVRSRSLKDFHGHYRVWTKVALCWLLFSFCSATGAHHVWSEDIQQIWPADFWMHETLSWLIPAIVLGAGIVWLLHREMAGCRLSLGFLQAASVLYLASAALLLEVPELPSAAVQCLAAQGCAWAGHVFLALSMQWHARYVIFRSAEPSPAASRRWKIPKPHFSWGRLASRKAQGATRPAEDDVDADELKIAARPSSTIAEPRKKSAPRSKGAEPESAPSAKTREPKAVVPDKIASAEKFVAPEPAKPSPALDPLKPERDPATRIRVDSRHGDGPAPGNTSSTPARGADARPEPSRETRPERVAVTPPKAAPSPAAMERPAIPERKPQPPVAAHDDETEEQEPETRTSQPDLRGLSKKQRRRLMQEQRARERNGSASDFDSDDD